MQYLNSWSCRETTLTGESRFYISTPLGIEPGALMTGSKQVVLWTSEAWYECSEIADSPQGSPLSSQLCGSWSRKEDLQRVWNRDGRDVRDQEGLSYCRRDSLVMVRDEAHLRQGHSDQSHRGHQCSETTLTGESRFHISTPLWIEPGSLMTGSKRVVHWTSETWYECSEISGSPQSSYLKNINCYEHLISVAEARKFIFEHYFLQRAVRNEEITCNNFLTERNKIMHSVKYS
jgi:hypothetical protein